jgi:hypothetical protein
MYYIYLEYFKFEVNWNLIRADQVTVATIDDLNYIILGMEHLTRKALAAMA